MTETTRLRVLNSRVGDAVAVIAGAGLPFAFAPVSLWPLVFVCLVLLYISWSGVTPRRAALRGFLFGLASFGVGTSWVYHSLHSFGGMPAVVAAIAVALFVALLAVFPALAGWLAVRVSASVPLWLSVPAAWIIGEWLRAQSLWAFSWLSVGYSQASSPLAGYAPVFGIYGVSFVTALLAASVALFLLDRRSLRLRLIPIIVSVVAVGVGAVLHARDWSTADGRPLEVALVQANVDIEQKWELKTRDTIQQRYLELSDAVPDVDLVVWPESAMPLVLSSLEDTFFERLKRHPADFVFGVIEAHRGKSKDDIIFYNSAAVVDDAHSENVTLWRKSHLVPFGEYLPLRPVLGFVLDMLSIPMSDFIPYAGEQGAIEAAGTRIGISICFEDAFPRDMRPTVPEASLFVHISEDAWFGDSFGPPQRLEMGRMRALEFARPMVRASNTGMTGIIDEKGRVLSTAPQFTTHVQTGTVQPQAGATPFLHWHHWPVLGISMLILLAGGVAGRRRRLD